MVDSRIPGFYKLTTKQRQDVLRNRFGLSQSDIEALLGDGGLGLDRATLMVENCVGVFSLPIGLGLNFAMNGKSYIIPMVVEEPSVVAAVSNSAKIAGELGGFSADADDGHMIAQVQLVALADSAAATHAIESAQLQLLALANSKCPGMVKRGGGALSLEVRAFESEPDMLVVHLIVDCVDAMGANAVNAMAEGIAPLLETITGGRACLRILSNLADKRCARAQCEVPIETLKTSTMTGLQVAQGIVDAYRFAHVDPYRAATHNKGIMNGIDAVAIATGNDWRSVEAGAHAFAARDGQYRSLTKWYIDGERLCGEIELPMAVGIVGGSTGVHPTIVVLRKLLNVQTASELAMVMACTGLAQNLGALRALASEGIQRGHMALHARQAALAAGVDSEHVAHIATALVENGDIRTETARKLWRLMKH
jgi:hydroxymethylglutaryl-CoA reductase